MLLAESDIRSYDYDDDMIQALCDDRRPRWRVYHLHRPIVVLGRGSNPCTELHLDACKEDGIPLFRRQGGGCAVIVDPGNVIVSVVLPMNGIAGHRPYFDRLSEWLLDGLRKIGFADVHRAGISDLAIQDRKVAGSCIYCSRDLLYFSATLLVAPRVEFMERYLKHPLREPDYRRGRTHSDFVGMLSDGKSEGEVEKFTAALREALRQTLPGKFLSSHETACQQQTEGQVLANAQME
ncbi:MAG: hypothetical protein V1784_02665 [bacterium]